VVALTVVKLGLRLGDIRIHPPPLPLCGEKS